MRPFKKLFSEKYIYTRQDIYRQESDIKVKMVLKS